MCSREEEATHISRIQQILAEGGVECPPAAESSASSEYGAEEFHRLEEALLPPEGRAEEQAAAEPAEEGEEEEEEQVYIFPTPSLRKLLPDHIRELEKINRIHVLPEEFLTAIDPEQIPVIAATPRQVYVDILGALVGCSEYRSSLAEYWFLDTLANLLRRAQEDGFDRASQAALMLWWCETMKEVQVCDAADRARFLRRLRDNMAAAAAGVAARQTLPAPADVGVDYRPPAPTPEAAERHAGTAAEEGADPAPSDKPQVNFDDSSYQCALARLAGVLHYIYDVFSTDYQFELIQSIFTFAPEYQLVDAAHCLQVPKTPFSVVKAKDKKKPKAEKPKKVVGNAEYVRLMEIKEREEQELQILHQLDRQEWERRSHILPLSLSSNIDAEFYERYWPAPPEGRKKKK